MRAVDHLRRRVHAGIIAGLLIGASAVFAQKVAGPAKAKAGAPEIPFDSVPNFFKLPAGLYMGEGTGVANSTPSSVSSASTSSSESVTRVVANSDAARSRDAGSLSQHQDRRAPGVATTLRARFGPQ